MKKEVLAVALLLGLAAGLFACGKKEIAIITTAAPSTTGAATGAAENTTLSEEELAWLAEYEAQYPYTYKAGGFTIRYYVENGMAFVDYDGTWVPDDDTDGTFAVPVAIGGMPVRWAWEADDEEVSLRKLHCTELIVPAGVKAVSMDLSSAETVRLGPDVESFLISRGAVDHIEADPESKHLRSIDGVLFNRDGTALLQYPTGRQQARYEIPEGVEAIAPDAIWFSRPVALKEVVVPASVTVFPDDLDDLINTYGYQLTFIVMPDSAAERYFKRQMQSEAYRNAKEETGEEPFLMRAQGLG